MVEQALGWLSDLSSTLLERGEIAPSFLPPTVSFDALAQGLENLFQCGRLSIEIERALWEKKKRINDPKRPLLALVFGVGSLPGYLLWRINALDLNLIMNALLMKRTKTVRLSHEEFLQGFHRFLALELLQQLYGLGLKGEIAPRLVGVDETLFGAEKDEKEFYLLSIAIGILEQRIPGQLLLHEELYRALETKSHEKIRHDPQSMVKAFATFSPLLHLEVGRTHITPAEWSKVKNGDFLLLDSTTMFPGEERGRVIISCNQVPLFRGMVKGDKLKILEYPNLSDDQRSALTVDGRGKTGGAMADELLTKMENIPFEIVVEVGRIELSLEKLAALKPGSLLEVGTHQGDRVSLVVQGKKIADGELLRLGESMVGVRILHIAR